MTVKNRKVTLPVAFGFGLTDIIGGGAFTIIGAWLLYFYTTFVGLSPWKRRQLWRLPVLLMQ